MYSEQNELNKGSNQNKGGWEGKNAVVNEPKPYWLGEDNARQKEEHICIMSMWCNEWNLCILGDPGADGGGER